MKKRFFVPLELGFHNEWNRTDAPPGYVVRYMNLVAIMSFRPKVISKRVMNCVVTYDYAALGRRVGIIDRMFFRPAIFRAIIESVDESVPLA